MNLLANFRTLSPSRQVLLVLTLVVLLAGGLTVAYFTAFRTDYAPLFTRLRTMDAATIVADLDKRKVPYRLKDGGATVLVPAPLVDTTRLSLMSEDLPLKGTVGFELFNKSDMGLTEFAQKINYQRALQGELSRTIMTIDAIDSARVHLSLPEATVFREDRRAPKASVTLVTRQGRKLSDATVRGVRRLVAAAIPDLDPGNVIILDADGEVVSSDAATEAPLSPGLQTKRAIEQYYAAEVRRALDGPYPGGEVMVEVLPPIEDGAAREPDASSLQAWTPQDRHFRLSVAVGLRTALTREVQDDVRAIVARAAGLRLSEGDVVSVAPAGAPLAAETRAIPPPAPAPPPSVEPAYRPSGPAPQLGSRPVIWAALGLGGLALLAAAAFGLSRRRRALPRSLTAEQRLAYAARLRGLLEDRVDAASGA